MKNSVLTLLCCVTLLAVFTDLYQSHHVVNAQVNKQVYVDEIAVHGAFPAPIITRGTTVVGFSCVNSDSRRSCFVASE
jgi:hypothetical protein